MPASQPRSPSPVRARTAVSRRTLLRSATLTGALVWAAPALAHAAEPVFAHGVASGDPLPDAVVLWTRVTPSPDATPGSGRGDAVDVEWAVSRDEAFTEVVANGRVTAGPSRDHTVSVDVDGLAPATTYFYRFACRGTVSAVGRTRTTAAPGTTPERLRFGVASCSNWEAGFFAAYRHLAARDDLDAVVHLGDYLYEYARGGYAGRHGAVRPHEPAHEIVSLADYRIRHAQYKTDPDLQALHARVPWIVTWDDHESANDAYAGGAENHDPATEGAWADRRAAALQAYLEWMPVRTAGSAGDVHLYRRFRFGDLAELSMLDLRSYRDRQVPALAGAFVDAPDRSITGPAQMEWLIGTVTTTSALWNLIGNPVMIAPLALPPLEPDETRALTELTGIPEHGVPVNADQWDGYAADRARLFDALAGAGRADTVFLTGDIHSSWCADLPLDPAAYPASPVVGTEMVVTSVTSKNFDEILGTPPRSTSVGIEAAVTAVNRHIRWTELDSHGYGVFEVTAQAAQMDWFFVDDPTDPAAGVRVGASMRVPRGAGRVEPAAPLG
ncbi:alkaline phosphatase D family protein [Rhodococcus sp. HNM0569]|uniref:alkaline phosphatase D family protein n=1 Tax=Rhodococcus sp. HNM0569 TaxID=2716340 RepID=UPI003211D3FB